MVTVSPVGEKIINPVCARLIFIFPPSRVMVMVVVNVVVKSRIKRVTLHAVMLEIRLLLLMEISRMLVVVIMIMKVVLVNVVQFAETDTQAVFVGLVSPYGGRGIRVGAVRARVRPGALLSGNHFACVQRRCRGANVLLIINR